MQILLGGVLWSFCYHFLNGIRHLCWDLGFGFERGTARASGWVVAISSVLLTAALWMLLHPAAGSAA